MQDFENHTADAGYESKEGRSYLREKETWAPKQMISMSKVEKGSINKRAK